MGEEGEQKPVSGRDYLWGAVVSIAPTYVVNTYRDYLVQFGGVFAFLVLTLAALAGGALAGFSVARKSGQDYRKAGVTTGLVSYLLYALLLWVLGFGVINVFLEDAGVITGFVGGGALGAKLWENRSRRSKTFSQ